MIDLKPVRDTSARLMAWARLAGPMDTITVRQQLGDGAAAIDKLCAEVLRLRAEIDTGFSKALQEREEGWRIARDNFRQRAKELEAEVKRLSITGPDGKDLKAAIRQAVWNECVAKAPDLSKGWSYFADSLFAQTLAELIRRQPAPTGGKTAAQPPTE